MYDCVWFILGSSDGGLEGKEGYTCSETAESVTAPRRPPCDGRSWYA